MSKVCRKNAWQAVSLAKLKLAYVDLYLIHRYEDTYIVFVWGHIYATIYPAPSYYYKPSALILLQLFFFFSAILFFFEKNYLSSALILLQTRVLIMLHVFDPQVLCLLDLLVQRDKYWHMLAPSARMMPRSDSICTFVPDTYVVVCGWYKTTNTDKCLLPQPKWCREATWAVACTRGMWTRVLIRLLYMCPHSTTIYVQRRALEVWGHVSS